MGDELPVDVAGFLLEHEGRECGGTGDDFGNGADDCSLECGEMYGVVDGVRKGVEHLS